jgi:hypothetical protein
VQSSGLVKRDCYLISEPHFSSLLQFFCREYLQQENLWSMGSFRAGNFHVNGSKLYVNWQGLSFNPATQLVLDVVSAGVPEPVTINLFGPGLLGLGASQRRRK